jgi:hypothetical protein
MEYNIKIAYDFSLKKDVKELLDYLKQIGFYKSLKKNKNRMDDIKYEDIGDTGIILKDIPYRDSLVKKESSKLDKIIKNNCVLCEVIQNYERIEPLSLAKIILWKGYLIRPNDFPYLENHLLLMSSDHNNGSDGYRGTQDELHLKKHILKDMVQFYKLMNMEGTMFFNGLAGNTQLHFHFHYVKEKFPLEDFIFKSTDLIYNEFKTKNKSKVFIFDSDTKKKCFRGLLFIGSDKHVCSNVYKVLKKIKSMEYEYNVIIMPNRDQKKNIVMVVFIRNNKVVKKTDPPLGASIIAGYYTRSDISIADARLKKIENKIYDYCNKIIVTPTESIIRELF